jgi:translocator protein
MALATTRPRGSWLALAGMTLLTAGSGLVGARVSGGSRDRWYRRLDKPPYNPPDRVFGPVWTGLYTLSVLSGWRVFRSPPSPARTRSLRLWLAQWLFNGAWSPLFFGLHRPRLALADLALLEGSLAAYVRETAKVDRPAAWMAVPYLAWTSFAGVLNADIVRRN